MRTSKRDRILDAAVNVINRDGVRAVTFESVAAEAKLTRGGLLYHFPSREALLRGIDEHLVQAWRRRWKRCWASVRRKHRRWSATRPSCASRRRAPPVPN
ncbi:TetR/AcrR family transcriptional regulator [Stenotrophomonas sp. CD2]|nr:TetR/AcrR family transcriptional regulator [Stenotrophomonas sp. CD2]